jgi:general secretion pathway protein L
MQSGVPALRGVTERATRFLVWWRDELVGLVPERARRLFADAEHDVVLAQVEGGFQVVNGSAPSARGEAPSVLSHAEALSALARMASSRRLDAVGIRLPLSRCFERRVELPKAARDDVRRMLNFDLERATPFRLSDVYTAHLMADGTVAGGRQRLRQLVVKRDAVDPLIADVKAAGLKPAFVDCWQTAPSAGLPVDFLEASAPARSGFGRHVTLPRALALAALLLAGLASTLWLWKHEAALADLRAQTAKLRTQAAAVRTALERSEAAVADLDRLQRMKLKQVPALEVLEELSKILPDSVWLSDLRIEGDTVEIAGLAKSGAALPSLFQRSPLFADATLTAPLTLDPREDKERFGLRVRIVGWVGALARNPTQRNAEARP